MTKGFLPFQSQMIVLICRFLFEYNFGSVFERIFSIEGSFNRLEGLMEYAHMEALLGSRNVNFCASVEFKHEMIFLTLH